MQSLLHHDDNDEILRVVIRVNYTCLIAPRPRTLSYTCGNQLADVMISSDDKRHCHCHIKSQTAIDDNNAQNTVINRDFEEFKLFTVISMDSTVIINQLLLLR